MKIIEKKMKKTTNTFARLIKMSSIPLHFFFVWSKFRLRSQHILLLIHRSIIALSYEIQNSHSAINSSVPIPPARAWKIRDFTPVHWLSRRISIIKNRMSSRYRNNIRLLSPLQLLWYETIQIPRQFWPSFVFRIAVRFNSIFDISRFHALRYDTKLLCVSKFVKKQFFVSIRPTNE